jgi:hypothetical protein
MWSQRARSSALLVTWRTSRSRPSAPRGFGLELPGEQACPVGNQHLMHVFKHRGAAPLVDGQTRDACAGVTGLANGRSGTAASGARACACDDAPGAAAVARSASDAARARRRACSGARADARRRCVEVGGLLGGWGRLRGASSWRRAHATHGTTGPVHTSAHPSRGARPAAARDGASAHLALPCAARSESTHVVGAARRSRGRGARRRAARRRCASTAPCRRRSAPVCGADPPRRWSARGRAPQLHSSQRAAASGSGLGRQGCNSRSLTADSCTKGASDQPS